MSDKNSVFGFPYGIIDGAAGDFTKIYSDRLEVPKEFLYISFLTCLGSILSRSLTIKSEIPQPPRLFILLLGESADDHKSTAAKKTIDFFNLAFQFESLNPNYKFGICHGVGSAEGLQKKLRKQKQLLLFFDEFKSFVGKAKIRNSVLLPCVNTLFESNLYENQTNKSEIIIKDAHLSMLAASTLQTYEETWSQSFTNIGFNNRLFIVPGRGRRRFSIPKSVNEYDKLYLVKKVREVIEFVGNYFEYKLTDQAYSLYHDWYMNRPTSIHSKRTDVYALRFMQLIAINERAKIINERIVNNVIELMDWQFEMRRRHDPIDADNIMAKMEIRIRKAIELKPRTERELKQYTNARRCGVWIFNTAKNNLQSEGEIKFSAKKKEWSINKE